MGQDQFAVVNIWQVTLDVSSGFFKAKRTQSSSKVEKLFQTFWITYTVYIFDIHVINVRKKIFCTVRQHCILEMNGDLWQQQENESVLEVYPSGKEGVILLTILKYRTSLRVRRVNTNSSLILPQFIKTARIGPSYKHLSDSMVDHI